MLYTEKMLLQGKVANDKMSVRKENPEELWALYSLSAMSYGKGFGLRDTWIWGLLFTYYETLVTLPHLCTSAVMSIKWAI